MSEPTLESLLHRLQGIHQKLLRADERILFSVGNRTTDPLASETQLLLAEVSVAESTLFLRSLEEDVSAMIVRLGAQPSPLEPLPRVPLHDADTGAANAPIPQPPHESAAHQAALPELTRPRHHTQIADLCTSEGGQLYSVNSFATIRSTHRDIFARGNTFTLQSFIDYLASGKLSATKKKVIAHFQTRFAHDEEVMGYLRLQFPSLDSAQASPSPSQAPSSISQFASFPSTLDLETPLAYSLITRLSQDPSHPTYGVINLYQMKKTHPHLFPTPGVFTLKSLIDYCFSGRSAPKKLAMRDYLVARFKDSEGIGDYLREQLSMNRESKDAPSLPQPHLNGAATYIPSPAVVQAPKAASEPYTPTPSTPAHSRPKRASHDPYVTDSALIEYLGPEQIARIKDKIPSSKIRDKGTRRENFSLVVAIQQIRITLQDNKTADRIHNRYFGQFTSPEELNPTPYVSRRR